MLINCTLSLESGAIVLTLAVSLSKLISTDMALLFVVGSSFDYLFPVDYGGIASTIIHLNSVVYVVVVPSSPLIMWKIFGSVSEGISVVFNGKFIFQRIANCVL